MTCSFVELQESCSNRSKYKRIMHLICDECGILFTRQWIKEADKGLHTCSCKCRVASLKSGHSLNRELIKKNRKHFGVDYHTQTSEVKRKITHTCNDRYGVRSTLMLKRIHDAGIQKASSSESRLKSHETMKRNGSYSKSNAENLFYEFLCEKFGKEHIRRQVPVNNWNIDFYINSLRAYIQFDGVYWHGLDRPYDTIRRSKNQRDQKILKTICKDKKQDEWFLRNKLSLIQITDREFEGIHSK